MALSILALGLTLWNGYLLFHQWRTQKHLEAGWKREDQWQKLCSDLQTALLDAKSPPPGTTFDKCEEEWRKLRETS